MAEAWIKMRVDLATHPKVVRIMSALKADRFRVIGALHAMWAIFDTHTEDGALEGYSTHALDEIMGWTGFSEAVISVGWLQATDTQLIAPQFETHNGTSARRRAQETVRKTSARRADNLPTKSALEKEKEKDSTPIVPKGTEDPLLDRAKSLLRIRPSTPLDSGQANAWKKNRASVIATAPEDWQALEWWFRQAAEKGDIAEFRRTGLGSLLNHWSDEVVRARKAAVQSGHSFSAEKKKGADFPSDWRDLISAADPAIHLPARFEELPESLRNWVFELDAERKKNKGGEDGSSAS